MVEGSYYCTIQRDTPLMNLMHEGVVEFYMQDGQLKGTMISTFFWLPSSFLRRHENLFPAPDLFSRYFTRLS